MTAPQSSIEGQALAQIPGYAEALTTAQTARKWHINLPVDPPDSYSQMRDDLFAAAAVGQDIDFNHWIERRVRIGNYSAWIEFKDMLNTVATMAEAAASTNLRDQSSHAFTWLNGELSTLQAEVLTLVAGPLGGIQTAAAATASEGSAQAWSRLQELCNDYEAIRSAQLSITLRAFQQEAGQPQGQDVLARSGHFADALHSEAHWVAMRHQARVWTEKTDLYPRLDETGDWLRWLDLAPKTGWQPMPPRSPWPGPTPRENPFETKEAKLREVFFLWAMAHAHPWVPTIAQLKAVDEEYRFVVKEIEQPQRGSGSLSLLDRFTALNAALDNVTALTGIDRNGKPTGKPRSTGQPKGTLKFGVRSRPTY